MEAVSYTHLDVYKRQVSIGRVRTALKSLVRAVDFWKVVVVMPAFGVDFSSGLGAVPLRKRHREIMEIIELYKPTVSQPDEMCIRDRSYVEDIEVTLDETNDEMVIEAVVFIEGLVLDKRILNVVTGVTLERDTCRASEDERSPARFRFATSIGKLFNRIVCALQRNR